MQCPDGFDSLEGSPECTDQVKLILLSIDREERRKFCLRQNSKDERRHAKVLSPKEERGDEREICVRECVCKDREIERCRDTVEIRGAEQDVSCIASTVQ